MTACDWLFAIGGYTFPVTLLRGGTMQDNTNDCIERGRFKRNDGEHNPNWKGGISDRWRKKNGL